MQEIKRIEGTNFDGEHNDILLFTNKEMVHTRFNSQEDSLQVINTRPIETPKIYSRVDKSGRLLTVDKSTNNLTVTNFKDGKVIKKYPGNLEEPYSKI
jgi:hypothetical protein